MHLFTRRVHTTISFFVVFLAISATASEHASSAEPAVAEVGPRPYYLVDDMENSPLEAELEACSAGPFLPTDFSIGHRGACMQFPEHTEESYVAAARMGAGIVEHQRRHQQRRRYA